MNVGIVGLGLIGGSMARSIKERTGHRVYGIDLDGETMSMARLCGAIDGALDERTLPSAGWCCWPSGRGRRSNGPGSTPGPCPPRLSWWTCAG